MPSSKSPLIRVNASCRLAFLPSASFVVALAFSIALGMTLTPIARAAGENFITFESGQTRPLAIHGTEVWVVNHLSDSVSVVDVSDRLEPVLTHTLWVGDEPQDVVFAGENGDRAFITTAHRGQNSPFPRSQYWTPGIGRADVWVFDAAHPAAAAGGLPETVLTLFGDKPRALAVSPDGSKVYAAIFRSGNQTTVIGGDIPCREGDGPCSFNGVSVPGPLPLPRENIDGVTARAAALIVKYEPEFGEWRDELGRSWNDWVKLDLPDLDVFEIDAMAETPMVTRAHAGVGTTLFNMAVNPASGALYVSNTEARNEVRFEGPGTLASDVKPDGEPPTVRGHLAESRITVIDEAGTRPRHLNPHIPYGAATVPSGVKEASLATPVGMAVSPDGETLFVAAYGSSRIAILSTADLEAGRTSPDDRSHIDLEGGGPSGLVLRDEHLYVIARDIFMNRPNVVMGGGSCNDCHTLSPEDGHSGTSGLTQNQAEAPMKVAQLRSAYQKVGMFGVPFAFQGSPYRPEHAGAQVRGFGFTHNGAIDTIFNLLDAAFFFLTTDESADLEAFVIAFPGDLPPVVGQQVTLRSDNAEDAGPRIDLLIARATSPWSVRGRPFTHECDLVVKGRFAGQERGYLMGADGEFRPDRSGLPNLSDAQLRAMASPFGTPLTYTCVPSGSGERIALDRDEDGVLNGDEGGLPTTEAGSAGGGSPGNRWNQPSSDSWDSPDMDFDLRAIADWFSSNWSMD